MNFNVMGNERRPHGQSPLKKTQINRLRLDWQLIAGGLKLIAQPVPEHTQLLAQCDAAGLQRPRIRQP